MSIQTIVLLVLVISLLALALTKNYYYYKFMVEDEQIKKSNYSLFANLTGTKFIGPFWIYPYRISVVTKNPRLERLKEKFNRFAKLHLVIFIICVLYSIYIILVKNVFS